jgi:hypothetical protein
VAAAVVGLADRAGRPLAAGEGVEQRGLADAGGAQQHARHARAQQRRHGIDAAAVDGRHRQDRRGAGERGAHLGHARRGIGVEVGLREHDERLGGRVGSQREHALDAAEAELAGERRHHDDEVDVRGEDLRLAAVVRRAHERAGALAHGVDGARLGVVHDPVADRWQVGGGRAMAQPSGDEAGAGAGVGDQLQAAAMDRGDAGKR